MEIDTPPCFFCQSETQSTFCSNCAINHHLIHVQTFNNTDGVLNNISCQLKDKTFKATTYRGESGTYTRILQIKPKEGYNGFVYDYILTLNDSPLTPSNIMDKLPLYLTFS